MNAGRGSAAGDSQLSKTLVVENHFPAFGNGDVLWECVLCRQQNARIQYRLMTLLEFQYGASHVFALFSQAYVCV
jgi:hypothetical protein